MLKHLGVAVAGLVALGAAFVPQVASAQGFDHGGPGDIRIHGGQGHFGQDFRGGQGRMGGFGGMERRGPDNFRYGEGHRQFGQDQGFRFDQNHRSFGEREGFRFNENRRGFADREDFRFRDNRRSFGEREGFRLHPRPGQFRDREFAGERRFEYHRGFGTREFRPGVRFGMVRHYPVYGGYRYRHGGFRAPYASAYLFEGGYGVPRAGCSTRRNISLTPLGWHKIVTIRTCYVR